MDRPDDFAHSFIVSVRLLTESRRRAGASWQAQVTHVPSGERRYFRDLDGIFLYIALRLARAGLRLGAYWRARVCADALRRQLTGRGVRD